MYILSKRETMQCILSLTTNPPIAYGNSCIWAYDIW